MICTLRCSWCLVFHGKTKTEINGKLGSKNFHIKKKRKRQNNYDILIIVKKHEISVWFEKKS